MIEELKAQSMGDMTGSLIFLNFLLLFNLVLICKYMIFTSSVYIVDNAADHHHQGKDHHHRQGKDLDLKQKQSSRSSSQVGSCLFFTVFHFVA